MKVSILSLEYPPSIYGGVGVHVDNIASSLSILMKVEVRTKSVPGAPDRVDGNPAVRRYSVEKVAGNFGPAAEALMLDIKMASDPMDSDIVHSHTWYMNMAGALAKKLHGIPAVATVHSLEPLRPWKADQLGRGYELSKWMEREGLCSADKVIAVSAGMKRDIMKCYPIPSSKIEVIYNGIDPSLYRKKEDPSVLKRLGIRKPYVLFVGRLTRQKGVFDLLKASKAFEKGTQLVLATGKADEPGIHEELTRALKGRTDIVWIDTMLGKQDTIALYSGAAVSVTPSVYEPFGIVVIEAMACGSPVVASGVGGILEIIENGRSGFLVKPKSPGKFAEAVNRVLGDTALAGKLAANARKRVEEKFTWKVAAKSTFELYKKLA